MNFGRRVRRTRRLTAASAVAAVLAFGSTALAGVPISSSSVTPSGSIPNAWGWATGRLPTTVTYLLPATDGADAVTSQPYVTRRTIQGGPAYMVTFPYAWNQRPMVALASSIGSGPTLCGIADPPSPNDVNQLVLCRNRHGTLVESRFSMLWLASGDGGGYGHLAYVFAGGPTPGQYTPAYNTFNSTNAANQVTRLGTGRWRVYLPGLGTLSGHPQVTGDNGSPCRTVSWSRELSTATSTALNPYGGEFVDVACRDFSGHYLDAFWWLVFVDGQSLLGNLGTTGAYLWADQPTTARYHPSSTYSYSSASGAATVRRSALGTYVVTLPGMPKGGAALITPTGTGKAFCSLTSIRADATPQRVGVHCWRPNGTAVDAAFLLGYVH